MNINLNILYHISEITKTFSFYSLPKNIPNKIIFYFLNEQ